MFVAMYRWTLKPGKETRFQEGWHRVTVAIREQNGSLGSRLHKASDGTWIAYAQWPSRQAWEAARENSSADAEARQMMADSVELRHPDLYLDVVDDLLAHT